MDFIPAFSSFGHEFYAALSPSFLLVCSSGIILGIIWGAMPALSTTMAMALMIGFSATMNLHTSVMFLLGVYTGSVFGGVISAIFINIPGTPSAVCTMIEGFPLAKKGEGGTALSVAIFSAAFGNMVGILLLVLFFPIIIAIALKFGAWEIFLIAFCGIGLSGLVTSEKEHPLKGWISGWIGVLISLIGLDSINAYPRFTFEITSLYNGVEFIPLLIGLFGLTEVVKVLPQASPYAIPVTLGRIMPPWRKVFGILRKHYKTAIHASWIGAWIGFLPALGSDVAAYSSYVFAKRRASKEEAPKYGKGSYEGIIAAGVAENACIGGDLLPTLTLGIPGSAPAAAYLGALNLHNVVVGPMINFTSPGLVYFHYAALLIANILFIVIAFSICKPTIRLLSVPRQILMPLIVPICVIGAFALTLSMSDVYAMLIFGLIGYLLDKNGTSLVPMCIGFILGPMADLNFRRAVEIFSGQPIWDIFSRPLGDLLILLVLYTYYIGIFKRKKTIPILGE